MVRSDRFRRVVLVLPALAFIGVAVGTLISPQLMASQFSIRLEHVDALNEFRAIYVGLWLAQAALFLLAARRVGQPLIGDLGGLLIAGQVAGRLVSLGLDGVPSGKVWPTFVVEALGALLVLVVRPSPRS